VSAIEPPLARARVWDAEIPGIVELLQRRLASQDRQPRKRRGDDGISLARTATRGCSRSSAEGWCAWRVHAAAREAAVERCGQAALARITATRSIGFAAEIEPVSLPTHASSSGEHVDPSSRLTAAMDCAPCSRCSTLRAGADGGRAICRMAGLLSDLLWTPWSFHGRSRVGEAVISKTRCQPAWVARRDRPVMREQPTQGPPENAASRREACRGIGQRVRDPPERT